MAKQTNGLYDLNETRSLSIFIFVSCLYVTTLMLAFITSVKVHILDFNIFTVALPAGTIAFALTFFCTDIISEVWGKKHALILIIISLVLRLFCLAYFGLTIGAENVFSFIQAAPFWTPDKQTAIEIILGGSNKIIWIGIITFLVGAVIDIQIYHYFKDKAEANNYQGPYNKLWFRNNFSTVIGQAINSILFIALIFGTQMPVAPLVLMMFGLIGAKIIIALVDTIPLYLLRNIAQGNELFDFSK